MARKMRVIKMCTTGDDEMYDMFLEAMQDVHRERGTPGDLEAFEAIAKERERLRRSKEEYEKEMAEAGYIVEYV